MLIGFVQPLSPWCSGYASSIHNLKAFEKSVTAEILCHDMEKLQDPHLFSEAARLVRDGTPTKKLLSFLQKHLNLEDMQMYSCLQAHMSPAGICTKGDICVLEGKPLQICQVWLHVRIGLTVLSMVSMWDSLKVDDCGCHALCKKKDDAVFVQTQTLGTTTSYMHFKDSLYKVIIPFKWR